MSERSQPYGFWIRIDDRDSARYAVRMSGLPVFLGGVFQAILAVVEPAFSVVVQIVMFGFAALLICAGLLIRREVAWVVPVVCGLLILPLSVGLVVSAIVVAGSIQGGAPSYLLLSISWQSVIPVLLLLMMVSGIRGWWWLHRQESMTPPGP